METNFFFEKALHRYDLTQSFMKKIESLVEMENLHIDFIMSNIDSNRNKILFIHPENKKILFQSEYEIIGAYYDKLNVWSWAWAMPSLSITDNYTSKKMLTHILGIDQQFSPEIKLIIMTPRSVISDKIQIDTRIAIACYIYKHNYVYRYDETTSDGYNLISYIVLFDNPESDQSFSKFVNESTKGKTTIY